ncbi:MAG: flavodoxin [Elusimicrobiota bacterium]|jgi:flavodoxin|nr:flavodoxin [Elusimicrobiota bacterium]
MAAKLFLLSLIMVFAVGSSMAATQAKTTDSKSTLIVYYSRTGNTEQMAQKIHQLVGGDIVAIKPVKAYPQSYDDTLKQAKQEINSGYKPPLSTTVDISKYDVIFVGYPIWYGTIPPPIDTFLAEHNFSGKTVIPFCVSGSSSGDKSFKKVKELSPSANVIDGLQIRGANVGSSDAAISGWLKKINIVE